MHYDYLIVGAGIFGAVFAHEMKKAGKECLVIDKSQHIAGHIYTAEKDGIHIHQYGAHIFHTPKKNIWDYVNQFGEFNHFVNSPVAVYKDELYNLPFNMNTFSKMWNIRTPQEAKARIKEQIEDLGITDPKNLEEQALSLVGTDIYEKLVKEYTEKQWGKECKDLPAFIIKRLPVRFTYDNNYFNDPYQGIPKEGYTSLVVKMLDGVKVLLNTEYKDFVLRSEDGIKRTASGDTFDTLLFTGPIDEYYDYCLGELEYRSLRFETEYLPDCDNYQGNAVVNYTAKEVPYTRIIEHKHFNFQTGPSTVVTKEYPADWKRGDEPYYPINDGPNSELFKQYKELSKNEKNVIFGGRLGQYQYYDMDKVIASALNMIEKIKNN